MEHHKSTAATSHNGCISKSCCDSPRPGRSFKDIKWYMWPVIISIDALGPFTSDAYLPSLPHIADDLHTTLSWASATVQVNLISLALGSIAVGILADRYGRRPVLSIGLSIYVASNAVAAWSPHIGVLVAARTTMGFTQGCQVLAPVLVRDLIDDTSKRMQIMALLGGFNAGAIVVAPSIGGILGKYLGWRWVFGFLAIWGTLSLLGYMALIPETKPAAVECKDANQEESNESLATSVRTLLASRAYTGFVGMFGLIFFSVMSMLTLLPLVLEDFYELEVHIVGFVMGVIPLCGMSGSLGTYIAGKFLDPFSLLRWGMIPYALVLGLNVSLAVTYQYVSDLFWPILLTCVPLITLNNMFIPVAMTLALEDMKDNAGVAQGFATFAQFGLMAAGSKVGTSMWNGTPSSFYSTLAIGMAATAAWFWIWCRASTTSDKLQGNDKENQGEISASTASSACQEQIL